MGLWAKIFPPTDPLNLPARLWVKRHLVWLQQQFGFDRLINSPIITPTDKFFPDRFDGSPATIEPLFHRVCDLMEVSREIVQLRLFSNDQMIGFVTETGFAVGVAGGTYEEDFDGFVINLDRAQISSPMTAVAILAHELSHLRLLGENRVDPDRLDHELLTDLCAVYFGFGVFAANSPAYVTPTDRCWPGTGLWMPEYMTLPMHAYALALIAQVRFEENPPWAKYLKRDAASAFRHAQKWLATEQAG